MSLNGSRPSIGEAGMRIMRLLIGHPPLTMTEMIDALHVTRNAITEQINDLIANHYVRQTQERDGGRGRPRYLFSATELAMKQLFEGYQDVVVPAMWRSLRRQLGDEAVEQIAQDVADEIADRFIRQMHARTPQGRIREFFDILERQGRLVEINEKKNAIEIRKYNCPFISMSDETGTLCYIDQLCMRQILGEGEPAPVKLISSRNEGNPCCTFRLDLSPKTGPQFCNLGDGI